VWTTAQLVGRNGVFNGTRDRNNKTSPDQTRL
jgi:hypothetical protein